MRTARQILLVLGAVCWLQTCTARGARPPVRPAGAPVTACTPQESELQARLFSNAYDSVHLWTACGDQSWLEALASTSTKAHHTVLDIGCNKGYETARMFELFAPSANIRPANLTQLYGACEAACGSLDCDPPPASGSRQAGATLTSVCVEASHKTYTRTHVAAAALLLLPRQATPGNRWRVLHRAASNHTGPHSFPDGCDTELCTVGGDGSASAMVTVKGTTVDDLVAKHGFDYVDYIKIDTEGFDPAVLQGAQQTLSSRKVGLFQFEYHGLNLWKSTRLEDIVTRLKSFGYVCYFDGQPTLARLTDCWMPVYELKQWSNVVCIAQDHKMVGWMEEHSFLGQVRASG